MSWADLHNAPRDRAIWLFLPCAKWVSDAQGRPIKVEHATAVAQWDKTQSSWIARDTKLPVYPSLWNDAAVDGPKPSDPDLSYN